MTILECEAIAEKITKNKDGIDFLTSKILEHSLKYNEKSDLSEKTYLNIIGRMYYRNFLRRKKNIVLPLIDVEDNKDPYLPIDVQDSLDNAELKAIERVIIDKYFFENYTEEDIANELNTSKQNINRIKQNALSKLEKVLYA